MNDIEISTAAKTAWNSRTTRSDFLASLDPNDRSFAALQYDRMERLNQCPTPTPEEIEERAREISADIAFCRVASETTMPYETSKFIGRVFNGRCLSEGEQRLVSQIRADAVPTDDELATARQQAIDELTADESFLKERLGK